MSCQAIALWWISPQQHSAAETSHLLAFLPLNLSAFWLSLPPPPKALFIFCFSPPCCCCQIYPRTSCRLFTILLALQASSALNDWCYCPYESAHLFFTRPYPPSMNVCSLSPTLHLPALVCSCQRWKGQPQLLFSTPSQNRQQAVCRIFPTTSHTFFFIVCLGLILRCNLLIL